MVYIHSTGRMLKKKNKKTLGRNGEVLGRTEVQEGMTGKQEWKDSYNQNIIDMYEIDKIAN